MKPFFLLILLIVVLLSCRQSENWESLGNWGFSPNGDGINELFILAKNEGIESKKLLFDTTKVNEMTILENKTSNIVLKTQQYQRNWWNGKKNNSGGLVPIGLYEFYLELEGDKTYFGYVYVKY